MATKSTTTRRRAAPASTPAAEVQGNGGSDDAPESLDQVRDILFGGQMRAVESRLERLETRIMREVENVQAAAAARMDVLENMLRAEAETAEARLDAEREQRVEALKEVTTDLRNVARDFEKRIAGLDTTLSKADAELRDQILTQAATTARQLKEQSDAILADLKRETHELRSEKIDTAALVALFSDMALRLTDELPGDPNA